MKKLVIILVGVFVLGQGYTLSVIHIASKEETNCNQKKGHKRVHELKTCLNETDAKKDSEFKTKSHKLREKYSGVQPDKIQLQEIRIQEKKICQSLGGEYKYMEGSCNFKSDTAKSKHILLIIGLIVVMSGGYLRYRNFKISKSKNPLPPQQ